MVRVAVAGGTGNVATEVLRAPIASGNHEITIFTRSHPSTLIPGVSYKKVDYADRAALTDALKGFDVCLSFLVVHLDTDCLVQKNLIHACIAAGVKRFAPSEWGIKNGSDVPPYENKDTIAKYLEELKHNGQLGGMQYCLFQPGIFMDYFAHPCPLSPGLITWPFFVDFERRRAMVLDAGDQPLVVTAVADISGMLDRALGDGRAWPAVGGMQGARTSINELLALGRRLRGGEWSVEHVRGEDVEKGVLTASWVPIMSHPVIPQDDREAFSREFVIMFFKAILRGAWDVSNEWNERFPDYKFTGLGVYLERAWEDKE